MGTDGVTGVNTELQLGTAAGREMMREQTLVYFEEQRFDMTAWAQLFSVGQEWLPRRLGGESKPRCRLLFPQE